MRTILALLLSALFVPAMCQNYATLIRNLELESRNFKLGDERKFLENDPAVWSYEAFIKLYNFVHKTELDAAITNPYALDQTISTIFGPNPPADLVVNKQIYDQVHGLEEKISSIHSAIVIREHSIRELKGIKLPMEEYFVNTREDKSNYPKEKERLKKSYSIDQLTDQIKKLKADSAVTQSNLNDLVINKYPVSYNYIKRKGITDRNLVPVVNKPAQNKFAKWYEQELTRIQTGVKSKFRGLPDEMLTDLAESNSIINEHMKFIDTWDQLMADKGKMFQPSTVGYARVKLNCQKIMKFKHIESIQPFVQSAQALIDYVEANRKYYLFFMFISSLNETIGNLRTNTKTVGQPIEVTIKAINDMKDIDLGTLSENEAKVFQGFAFARVTLSGSGNHQGLKLLQAEIIEIFNCGEVDASDFLEFNNVKGIRKLQLNCRDNCKCKVRNLKDVQGSLVFEVVQL